MERIVLHITDTCVYIFTGNMYFGLNGANVSQVQSYIQMVGGCNPFWGYTAIGNQGTNVTGTTGVSANAIIYNIGTNTYNYSIYLNILSGAPTTISDAVNNRFQAVRIA